MANNNIGTRRLVVGAHYGARDWLAQRATAIVMALYTVILLVCFLAGSNFSYEGWAGLFAQQWFKIATFVALLSLAYHAWIGMRDVWMDYATKSVGVRVALQIATIVWLVACIGWAVQIIWRV
jgi:succinate dehydrogenase / fumarate reductase membrane anchor subunit